MRTTVHDELAAMRTDISGLAGELRGYTAEQGPRVAVLEHRLTESEKDIAEIKAAKKDNKLLWCTVALSVLSAVLSWLLPLLSAAGKG